LSTTDLVQSSRETIQKGSKSFAAAAAFFDAETRADAGVPGVVGSAKATAGLMIADLGAAA
jgi:hypothetical protein